jgi:hypothetical protein
MLPPYPCRDNFERAAVDVFELDAAVGDLQALRIGHDNSGLGPGWHLQVCWGEQGRGEGVAGSNPMHVHHREHILAAR